jgi:5'-3' exonuclease
VTSIHLIDGTYELFRHFYAVPSAVDGTGQEVGAARGVVASVLSLLEGGATHIGVATDHVVESFRNELYPGYKTGEGIDPRLFAQFPIVEEALEAMGIVVWPMVRYEADDALASAAAKAALDNRVEQVIICTPDKDLAQCVSGDRVVQLDRQRGITRNEAGVVEKWGVAPASIPDYLAVVGDTADGFPGLAGWGAKAAASMFAHHRRLEDIPKDWRKWPPSFRSPERLSKVLFEQWDDALLYRTLATLVDDVPVFGSIDDLQWRGPTPAFAPFCDKLRGPELAARAGKIPIARRTLPAEST